MCNTASYFTVWDYSVSVTTAYCSCIGGTLIERNCLIVEGRLWQETSNSADGGCEGIFICFLYLGNWRLLYKGQGKLI